MSENRINICVIGGEEAEFEELSQIINVNELLFFFSLIKTKTKLVEMLESNQCHLILGNSNCNGFNIFDVAEQVSEFDNHIPIVGVYESTELSVVDAMKKGLSDYVELSNQQHLHMVIERELLHVELAVPASHISGKDFTGLFSRLQFLEFLEKQLPAHLSNDKQSALLYLQLDNFSWINESIGILSGDIFLKNTANTIAHILEKSDVAARYQGGSFILLVQAENLKKLSAKADMVREAIAEAVSDLDDHAISSTCSIGIQILNDTSEPLTELISNASNASEIAKSGGGDAVHLYNAVAEASKGINDKDAWNIRIQEAFEHDLFLLFYQPIISLMGDNKPRYEVLLRMIDEEKNIVAPGTFLPFAERAGLMSDIDRRVILHSLQKAVAENEEGNNIEVFIKLSGKSLDDKKMPSWISSTIKEVDFPSENIVFEITESLALTHLTQTRHLVNSLRSLNCKIALDHFGTRLKSFNLLNQIDVDYLKIDGSLIQNLATNKAHQTIVKKIIKTAKKKKLEVIAESVQEAGSLPIIWQFGIHFVQGYFLQIPDGEMEYDFTNALM